MQVLQSKVHYLSSGRTALLKHSDKQKHKNAQNTLSRQSSLGGASISSTSPSTSTSVQHEHSSSNFTTATTVKLQPVPPTDQRATATYAKSLFKVDVYDFRFYLRFYPHSFSSMLKPPPHKECDFAAIFDHFSISRTKVFSINFPVS